METLIEPIVEAIGFLNTVWVGSVLTLCLSVGGVIFCIPKQEQKESSKA